MKDKKSLAPNLLHSKVLFLGCFEPPRGASAAEQTTKTKNKAAYAPRIELLPVETMAVTERIRRCGL